MNVQNSVALVRSEQTNANDYRFADEGNDIMPTETALMIVRPSLLQFVTESVPAIDLDNRQHLMRAVLEIMTRMESTELDLLNNGAKSARHTVAPMVSLVNPTASSQTNNLRNLFHRQNSLQEKPTHQIETVVG